MPGNSFENITKLFKEAIELSLKEQALKQSQINCKKIKEKLGVK